MTTGPDGQRMTVEQRLADIRARYGPAIPSAAPWPAQRRCLTAAVMRVTRKLTATLRRPRGRSR